MHMIKVETLKALFSADDRRFSGDIQIDPEFQTIEVTVNGSAFAFDFQTMLNTMVDMSVEDVKKERVAMGFPEFPEKRTSKWARFLKETRASRMRKRERMKAFLLGQEIPPKITYVKPNRKRPLLSGGTPTRIEGV